MISTREWNRAQTRIAELEAEIEELKKQLDGKQETVVEPSQQLPESP